MVRHYDEIPELFLVTEELRQLAGKRVRRDVDFCQSEYRPRFSGREPEQLLLKILNCRSFGLEAKIGGSSLERRLSLRFKDFNCSPAIVSGIFSVKAKLSSSASANGVTALEKSGSISVVLGSNRSVFHSFMIQPPKAKTTQKMTTR
ncbi:hypothetical protein ACFX13_007096 [Malus domestica]